MYFTFQSSVEDIVDKQVKEDITTWYLSTIENTVIKYLVAKGYQKAALPFNYIDNRPADLSIVKSNLRLSTL